MRLRATDKRRRHGAAATMFRNLLRRVAIKAASALEATIEGFEDAEGNVETDKAEVFGAAGVAHRPAGTDKAEALVAHLGGDANGGVVIATRNADAARALLAAIGKLGAGETAVFNTDATARVRCQGGGVVEIVSLGNPLSEPTYKATTHDVLMQALMASVAGGAALVGGAATSVINAGIAQYSAGLPTAKTGSKLS